MELREDAAVDVAFLGLGTMGLPIAGHMVTAGFRVNGFDPSRLAQRAATKAGINLADSVGECARSADVVFMMLPSVRTVEAVLHEVLKEARPNATIVELGTIGRENALRHSRWTHDAGLRYLDAPVINGGEQGAINGTLRILAGGPDELVDELSPALNSFSTDVIHLSEVGAGQAVKMVHNTLLAVITCATAEALSMARDFGLDPTKVAEVFKDSSAQSFALEWLFPPALKGDYSGGAKVEILLKDLRLTVEEATTNGAPIPLSRLATDMYEHALKVGHGKLDMGIVLQSYYDGDLPGIAI